FSDFPSYHSIRSSPHISPFPYTTLFRSRYFQRDFRPLGSRRTILIQSSYQPIAPKAIITSSTTHTYLLRRSPHSSTDAVMVNRIDRKSTRLNSSHVKISYAVFCLKKKRG